MVRVRSKRRGGRGCKEEGGVGSERVSEREREDWGEERWGGGWKDF